MSAAVIRAPDTYLTPPRPAHLWMSDTKRFIEDVLLPALRHGAVRRRTECHVAKAQQQQQNAAVLHSELTVPSII
eukprot:6211225-Pleurochrysis_carterae.AAC.2